MPSTKITREQFTFEGDVLCHRPTGARFTAEAGHAEPVWIDWGRAGEGLPNGEAYDQDEVLAVAREVMRDHFG
jgi:hypothetical protein